MKISEFLQGRSVARQAVTRYINRHDEIFINHVKKDGKELDLDMVAIEALEKIYPLKMPVNVIDGVPKESFIKIQTMPWKSRYQNTICCRITKCRSIRIMQISSGLLFQKS